MHGDRISVLMCHKLLQGIGKAAKLPTAAGAAMLDAEKNKTDDD
jgi:hypothetical protein